MIYKWLDKTEIPKVAYERAGMVRFEKVHLVSKPSSARSCENFVVRIFRIPDKIVLISENNNRLSSHPVLAILEVFFLDRYEKLTIKT